MDTRSLRYFQAVAEFGSYSRGAGFLRVSQPAVSRQVGALEAELGRPLFVRHGHGVSLTDAGRTLLEHSQAILRQIEQAGDDVRRGGEPGLSGTVTLAVPPAAGTVLVPRLAQRLEAALPRVTLRVVSGFSTTLHEWLLRGRVDLACLHDPAVQPGFTVTPLVREEVFVVGRSGTLPGVAAVRARDLGGVRLILPGRPNASRRLLDGWLAQGGTGLDARMEVDDHMVIRAMLREGLGCSLLTQGAFRSDLAAGGIEARPLHPRVFWTLALMAADRPGSAATAAVASLVRDTVRAMLQGREWPGGSDA